MSDAALVITWKTYRENTTHHAIAAQIMDAHHLDPDWVNEMEVTEADALVTTTVLPVTLLYDEHNHIQCVLQARRRLAHPGHRR